MARYSSVAYTMQALVKYHGMKDWKLRLPYHDSISVNTTSMKTEASIDDARRGGVYVEEKSNESANSRLESVVSKLNPKRDVTEFRIDSHNLPSGHAKGIGYSSSAGAALTLLCHKLLVGGNPDLRSLSSTARLFAASASRSLVGGFSRLYAGDDDEGTYAEKFADERDLDLRMVIVPLPSRVRTEDAHREVLSSPFFRARVESAQRRCDEVQKAITGGDFDSVGRLAEKDTLELHSITMTGENGMIIMSEDSLRIIHRILKLRDEGVKAYYSMQTGPSVFVNTTEKDQDIVRRSLKGMGFKAYQSGVGSGATLT